MNNVIIIISIFLIVYYRKCVRVCVCTNARARVRQLMRRILQKNVNNTQRTQRTQHT